MSAPNLPGIDTVSSSPLAAMQHPGTFFELGPYELDRARQGGYSRVGVSLSLLNSAGEVLVLDHKGNHKLRDHTLGIASETVAYDVPGSLAAEPTIRTIGRCIADEVKIDPAEIDLYTRAEAGFILTDWPIGNRGLSGKLLGINIAFLLSDESAAQAAGPVDSDEAHRAFFASPAYLMDHADRLELRPGTLDCLRGLGEVGLLDTASLSELQLSLPDHDYLLPVEDIDLTTARHADVLH